VTDPNAWPPDHSDVNWAVIRSVEGPARDTVALVGNALVAGLGLGIRFDA
jgi:hypothetical protein